MSDKLTEDFRKSIDAAARLTRVSWDDLQLKEGDRLIVRTRNTTYEMLVSEPGRRRVIVTSDGRTITAATECCLVGTLVSTGGYAIMPGVIALGGRLEIQTTGTSAAGSLDRSYVLTAVQSVAVWRRGESAATVILPTAADA